MAFTKNGEPSDTKFAMIDRSIAHMVRSISKKAHTDAEFEDHMSKPEQKKKLQMFRIFVCLVGAVKLATKNVPAFQPNFALANKIFDYLDNQVIVGEYNLPRCTARKSLKREENLKTLCIMKAVADVFIFQQTALEFEAGKLDAEGRPQPFKFTMLFDVIRQLRATPELIFMAWSQSLDYNIGTAAHSFAAMTALCEKFGLSVGDWFKKPPSNDVLNMRMTGENHSDVKEPERQDGQTEEEYQQAKATYLRELERQDVDSKYAQLPQMVDANGVSLEDRRAILTGFERQRRATSLYRHTCTLEGNSGLKMDDPIKTIEQIMSKHDNPPDLDDASLAASQSNEYLPIYSSAIMASTVQTCCLYSYQAVVHWCADQRVQAKVVGNAVVGTDNRLNFAQNKTTEGLCKWNTAWLRIDGADGWRKFVTNRMHGNVTCKIFDLPHNGLRDLFYLLSTRDNSRRCTEEPDVPFYMNQTRAFVDEEYNLIQDATYYGHIRMRGVVDARGGDEQRPGTEHLKRNPYAKIPDLPLQRSIDFVNKCGRLPALMPLISNNVRDVPPVRMVFEGDKRYIELNTSAALEHTKMLAEASFRCSLHPGMQNMQEPFCDNSQGPEGLCVGRKDIGDSSGNSACTTFPYSYDMPTIALTLDGMDRYFDPDVESVCEMYAQEFGESLQFRPRPKDLPHMSLRFVGFEDSSSRRFLSMPLKSTPNPAFKVQEVGGQADDVQDEHTLHTHLQLALGHEPSEEEVARYMKSRAGSRSMSGVQGNLLSMSTYKMHTLTTLKERGMVSGEDDVLMHIVEDDPYGLRHRVAEIAGRKINKIVDEHSEMKRAKEFQPGAPNSMTREQMQEIRDNECRRVRAHLYATIELPKELDSLRKYGPLRVPTLSKMTYHNRDSDRSRFMKSKSNKLGKEKFVPIDASAQFKDRERCLKRALPGRAPVAPARPGSSSSSSSINGLSVRGLRDARDGRVGGGVPRM